MIPMYCTAPSVVTHIKRPTGPSHAQVGMATLKNGHSFEIWNDDFGTHVRFGDRVAICFDAVSGDTLPNEPMGTVLEFSLGTSIREEVH